MGAISRTQTLSNGLKMPSIGLGTWQQREDAVVRRVVRQALDMGYRLLDTASAYRNEPIIGQTLTSIFTDPATGLRREDIWITSKLAPKQQGFERATCAVQQSLDALQTDYIDLYLVHWPGVSGKAPESTGHRSHREGSWRALEAMYRARKVRAIGVSNFTVEHLAEMSEYAEIMPMVNQCELHPLCPQPELVEYCARNGIAFTAYASLGEAELLCPGGGIPELDEVARLRPELTRAQILLLWGLQHGAAVIPKASSAEHLRENLEVLDSQLSLGTNEMHILDGISRERYKHICWDPETVA